MSYLVLARKWRPQTFEEVVGQKPITQALQNAIALQRVSHAYLFTGPRGAGQTSVSRILATALLKPREDPPPHVIFVLATPEPHKIPLTILSRCQRYDFKRIPLSLIVDQLRKIASREEIEISDRSLHLLARDAEGSMRGGQSLLDPVVSFSGEEVADDQVAEVLGVIVRQIL